MGSSISIGLEEETKNLLSGSKTGIRLGEFPFRAQTACVTSLFWLAHLPHWEILFR
jgi:hypothetical protein